MELESALHSKTLDSLLLVTIKTYLPLSLSSFPTKERSSSNMNSTRKKQKRKLPKTRNYKESLASVPDNIFKITTTFPVLRTPRDTPLVSVQSKLYTHKDQSISNTESLRLQDLETTNPKKPTLNQNQKTRWTPTGAEKTVTGVICQGRTPVQANITMT